MKIVQYSPSERVDLPDITAMSWLPVGEYRRLIRTLMAGGTTSSPDLGRIIKGFKVEEATTTTIEVKYDIYGDGSDLSAAVGGHEFIGSDGALFIDQGQLLGDKGIENEQESGGAGSRTIDFSGDPTNYYVVEMRFTLTAAESGNRAFWDPGSDTEFIDNVETRYVPGWEIQRVPYPSSSQDDWIPLAVILWSGSSIQGNLDSRNFALEGTAPFSDDSQDIVAGPGDFDRSADRSDPTIGINHVWGAIRALEKQVMDLKGQDDGGEFNWYGRVLTPGPSGDGIGTTQTKSLRTLDSVTFKIGSGIGDWGDFNGLDGLEDCLSYIEANRDDLPRKIKILLRTREEYDGISTAFRVTSEHTLTDVDLEIIGDATVSFTQAPINIDLGFSGTAITIDRGGLILRNVTLSLLNSGENGIDVEDNPLDYGTSEIYIDNCYLSGTAGSTNFMLKVPSEWLRMVNTWTDGGVIHIGGSSPGSSSYESISTAGGQIDNCYFAATGLILRRNTVTSGTSISTVNSQVAHNLTISNTAFWLPSTTTFTNGAYISGLGCRGLTFDNCDLEYDGDANCILLGGVATNTIDLAGLDCRVVKTRFRQQYATHTVGPILGVGYAIQISNESLTPTSASDVSRNFLIDACRFTSQFQGTSSDGFGVSVINAGNVKVRDCSFQGSEPDSGISTSQLTFVTFANSNTLLTFLGAGVNNSVVNCEMGPNEAYATGQTYFPIVCLNQGSVRIQGNNITMAALDASKPDVAAHGYGAIKFESSNGNISNNTIGNFLTVNSRVPIGSGIWGINGGLTQIANNTFVDCGGSVIDYTESTDVVASMLFSNNFFFFTKLGYTLVLTLDAMITFEGAETNSNSFIGNRWNIVDADNLVFNSVDAIFYGNDKNPMVVGNCFPEGMLRSDDESQTPISGNGRMWGGLGRNQNWGNGDQTLFEVGPSGSEESPAFNVFSVIPTIDT